MPMRHVRHNNSKTEDGTNNQCTSKEEIGMVEPLEDLITARRLCWLGHVARMENNRLPKQLLFGWLPQRRPAHGTKLRWKDKVRKDLKRLNIEESRWYQIAQDRNQWRSKCVHAQESHTMRDSSPAPSEALLQQRNDYVCENCQRSFRRSQDMARHKCETTRPRRRRV